MLLIKFQINITELLGNVIISIVNSIMIHIEVQIWGHTVMVTLMSCIIQIQGRNFKLCNEVYCLYNHAGFEICYKVLNGIKTLSYLL